MVPAQLSPEAPPVPEQLVAFEDVQVSVVGFPAVMIVGDADSVAVTRGHVQITDTVALLAGVPAAVVDAIAGRDAEVHEVIRLGMCARRPQSQRDNQTTSRNRSQGCALHGSPPR